SPPQTTIDTTLAARLYHANGLSPIPWKLRDGRKSPTVKGWDEPTTRPALPALISRWRAGELVGLVTGRGGTTRNPIIVVDVDVKGDRPGDPTPFLDTTPAVVRTPSG